MVISMLTIGTISLIAFVIIEWKVAALPMMPREFMLLPYLPLTHISAAAH